LKVETVIQSCLPFYQEQEISVEAVVAGQFRVKRGGQQTALASGHDTAIG
jgi:hypothetical protein